MLEVVSINLVNTSGADVVQCSSSRDVPQSLAHSPMQAVWCWENPGGHLQLKPPMVLLHRNWQLCLFVRHSSRSEVRWK